MDEINITGCNFTGDSSVIRTYIGGRPTERLLSEIDYARSRTMDQEMLRALGSLEAAIERNNQELVRSTAKSFSTQFKSSLFADIAGAALKGLIGLFIQL